MSFPGKEGVYNGNLSCNERLTKLAEKGYDFVWIDAFCFGQNIPLETEFSHDAPEEEWNAILIVENHKLIAGLRIAYPKPGVGKIERVCVVREK